MKQLIYCLLCVFTFFGTISAQVANESLLYLAQNPPTKTPQIFAKGVISKESQYEFGSVFNKDGTAFFFGVDSGNNAEIRYTELIETKWSTPTIILSHNNYGFNDPFLSPDEDRLYFISEKAIGKHDAKQDHDIWYVERYGSEWSEPINAGPKINSKNNEYYMSFTNEGTMYFSSNRPNAKWNEPNFDIYYSKFRNGEFQEAIPLGKSVNSHHYEADVFVDPEEAYLIFCGRRPEGLGRGDLYISFMKSDGTWTQSVNMGDKINSKGHELCPFVSNDGKYLFYTSNEDIYWVSTEIIEDLKKELID